MDATCMPHERVEDKEGWRLIPEDASSASPEEKLLHSYDRFYKAINKVACKDMDTVEPLPPLEAFLQDFHLADPRLRSMEAVWKRAEAFCRLQKVVDNFHGYRSDVLRRLQRRSRTDSESPFTADMGEGVKEMFQSQSRLEQQMHFSNSLLVGMEQRMDQLPSLVCDFVQKQQARDKHEQTALRQMVYQNRQQMERMEQMIGALDSKWSQWGKGQGGVSLASDTWPETLHNNIVYSTSDGSSAGDVRGRSPVEETALSDGEGVVPGVSVMTGPKGKGSSTKECSLEEDSLLRVGEIIVQSDVRCQEVSESIKLAGSFEKEGARDIEQPDMATVLSSSVKPSYSPENTESSCSCNKPELPIIRSEKDTSHLKEKQKMLTDKAISEGTSPHEAFDEAFSRDILQVQENILVSSLGNKDGEIASEIRFKEGASRVGGDVERSTRELSNKQKEDHEDLFLRLLDLDPISFLSSSFSEFSITDREPLCPKVASANLDT